MRGDSRFVRDAQCVRGVAESTGDVDSNDAWQARDREPRADAHVNIGPRRLRESIGRPCKIPEDRDTSLNRAPYWPPVLHFG